jgi:hypothetical protein
MYFFMLIAFNIAVSLNQINHFLNLIILKLNLIYLKVI